MTQADNRTTIHTYDTKSQLISVDAPDGIETFRSDAPAGPAQPGAEDRVTIYNYNDRSGSPEGEGSGDQGMTCVYDAADRLAPRNADGITIFSYDALGQLVQPASEDGTARDSA